MKKCQKINLHTSCSIFNEVPNNALMNNKGDKFFLKICKTCSVIVAAKLSKFCADLSKLNTEEISLRNKLYLCCPELDLRITSETILCGTCFEIVNIINKFIYKKYERTEQLDKNLNFPSIQSIYLFQNYSFDIKSEIKAEELDLSEAEGSAVTGASCQTTTHKKYTSIDTLNRHLQLEKTSKPSCNKFKRASRIDSSHTVNKPFNYACHDNTCFKQMGEKLFKCSQCDYNSKQKDHLINHLHTHAGEKPFKCTQCNYSCTTNDSLKNHIHTHTNKKLFKCSHCDYRSINKNTLTTHIRKHTGEKPFICPQCNFSFVSKSSLRYHIRTHMREKPFKCAQCTFSTCGKYSLILHTRTHTGEKPFKCSQCDYSSTQKHHLIRHSNTHTGEKPFKCLQCDYTSNEKHSLIKHMSTHREEQPYKYCPMQERLFSCAQCDYTTGLISALSNHMHLHVGQNKF